MADYKRELEFGVSFEPDAASLAETRELARRAESLGLDLIGIQDHPYQWRFFDTWMLIATLLAETERIRIFPDVANLPLRGPAMIAKQAASLDVLSGGRFELGLGAGAFWEAIGAMGGPVRTPPEAVEALDQAIRIIRFFWSGQRAISFSGRFYSVRGLHPGPAPAHPISVWLGAGKPRMLALTGQLADGWIPSLPYIPPESVPEAQRRIDAAATDAGRDPAQIRRIYNLMGQITDGVSQGLLQGPVSHWVEELTGFVVELGFDTFIFWPAGDQLRQLDRFAEEVAPAVREAVARARRD
jgi:alkanesulfonate monooxygenase SsuD/methylene tetrahydromethanopterin reductase-like flavin-dependent oxidoreductase (luciferase family)